ncbi:MAG: hypothetical protein AAFX02_05990 [Pseudomonadota bacterium]
MTSPHISFDRFFEACKANPYLRQTHLKPNTLLHEGCGIDSNKFYYFAAHIEEYLQVDWLDNRFDPERYLSSDGDSYTLCDATGARVPVDISIRELYDFVQTSRRDES